VATAVDSFSVTITNTAPVLSRIADQNVQSTQGTLRLNVAANDPDGDAMQYSVNVSSVDPVAARAYSLDQELRLYQWGGTYFTNFRGVNEKYLAGVVGDTWPAYFILPSGGLYRWTGSIAASPMIAMLGTEYWANPSLLWNAKAPAQTASLSAGATASLVNGVLTVNRGKGAAGNLFVQVLATDGVNTTNTSFRVTSASNISSRMIASAADELWLAQEHGEAAPALPPAIAASQGSVLAWAVATTRTAASELSHVGPLHDNILGSLATQDRAIAGTERISMLLDKLAADLPSAQTAHPFSREHAVAKQTRLLDADVSPVECPAADHSLEQNMLKDVYAMLGELR
jgi:hypothetical protein